MEQLLIAMGIVGMLVVVTMGVTTVLVVRAARRRYRAARERLRGLRSAPVGTPAYWSVQNRRHRMWRAVTSAEHSIGLARASEVAVGDLPFLTERLRVAADGMDAVLRASARTGSLTATDRADCDRITVAGAEIQAAALDSLRTASRAGTEPVLSAIRVEVAALAAGVRVAHH